MSQPNTNSIVTVVYNGSDCLVSPGEVTVLVRESITFRNTTPAGISIMMSDEKMFEEHQFKVDPGSETTKTLEDVAEGEYPYAVFCAVIDDFAHASSMPKIIVRRQL